MTDIAHGFMAWQMFALLLFVVSRNEHIIEEPFPLIPSEMALQFLQWFNNKCLFDRSNLAPFFDREGTPFRLIRKNIKGVRKFLT